MKILIADDHELFRDGLWLMATQGFPEFALTEALSWGEVDEALDSHDDIVMMLVSADLRGANLFDAVSAMSNRDNPVAIAIFSEKTDPEFCRKLLECGAQAVIEKGTSRQLMIHALHMVISGGIYLPAATLSIAMTGKAPDPLRQPRIIHDIQAPGLTAAASGKTQYGSLTADMAQKLTRRQRDIAKLLAEGKSNAMIANDLGIAEGTVRIHVSAILRALDLSNRSQVAAMAARHTVEAPSTASRSG